jgi:hypothetical protein
MRAHRGVKRIIEHAREGHCATCFVPCLNKQDTKLLDKAREEGLSFEVASREEEGEDYIVISTCCPKHEDKREEVSTTEKIKRYIELVTEGRYVVTCVSSLTQVDKELLEASGVSYTTENADGYTCITNWTLEAVKERRPLGPLRFINNFGIVSATPEENEAATHELTHAEELSSEELLLRRVLGPDD